MKKIILFILVYITTMNAVAQSGVTSKLNRTATFIRQLKASELKQAATYSNPAPNEQPESLAKESNGTSAISWSLLCGSMNVYGMLSNQSRPLQVNPALNAVSFIHRKSDSYTPYPQANSNSGNIVAEISNDWGLHWDSTCIWSDPTNGGRYPQGALYNPPGNTNIANAYVVGCGPVVSNNAFTGDWYASKALGVPGSAAFNPTASTVTGAQQFLSFTQTVYPVNQAPHGWSMQGFTAVDNGPVRSLALIDDDNTDVNTMRGAMLVKGNFNAGVFNWTTDSIIPNVVIQSGGNRQFSTKVQMAWNQSGTVGYVVIIGALNSSVGSNRGLQPIVYKTSNSGQSWSLIPGINFNAPANASVLRPLAGVDGDPTLKIPYVDDFDMAVDKNNNLHLGLILASTASSHDDSLQYISQFTTSINPNDEYKWKHIPGNRPYLYDFIGDGSQAWKYYLVDSLSSEGPGSVAGSSGFNDNPWDISSGDKIAVDSRLQMSRTADGAFIMYSWAESDSSFIAGSKKWNIQPNIKLRCLQVDYQRLGCVDNNPLLQEYNVSKPSVSQGSQHPKVVNRATLHYMSPISATNTIVTSGSCSTVNITVPFTVTNSQPYSQLTNNSTWYTSAALTYNFCDFVGLNDTQSRLQSLILFPNPAKISTTMKFESHVNRTGEMRVLNLLGSEMISKKFVSVLGENTIEVDLRNFPNGIYFINVKLGEESFTKKLVIE